MIFLKATRVLTALTQKDVCGFRISGRQCEFVSCVCFEPTDKRCIPSGRDTVLNSSQILGNGESASPSKQSPLSYSSPVSGSFLSLPDGSVSKAAKKKQNTTSDVCTEATAARNGLSESLISSDLLSAQK